MSFHEKSAWACLVSIVVVFVPYFAVVFSSPGYPSFLPALIGTACALIAILTVVHIFFALGTAAIRRTGTAAPPDEREVGIELRSTKIACYVLSAVVMTWCLAAYAGIPLSGAEQPPALAAASDKALLYVHALFAGFVLANVTYYAALVVGYRRSA